MPDFPTFDHWFPPDQPPERRPAPAYGLRHPGEDDLGALQGRVGDWSEDSGVSGPGRAWTRHIAGTSWLAEGERGGRALVERFTLERAQAGATRQTAACRPDDRRALAFFGALGFTPNAGPGSRKLYGVPAFESWDGPGEDRVLLERVISP